MGMMQTAEGGLNEIHNNLARMRELAVQSASDGVNGDDRASIDLEFQQLKAEITRIGDGTEYNNKKLINGAQAKGVGKEKWKKRKTKKKGKREGKKKDGSTTKTNR